MKAFENQDVTITLNQPFSGGYITKNVTLNGQLPIIQLELNRNLYDASDKSNLINNPNIAAKTKDLNNKIAQALIDMYNF